MRAPRTRRRVPLVATSAVLTALVLVAGCAVDIHLGGNRILPEPSQAPSAAMTPRPSTGADPQSIGVATSRDQLILDEDFRGTVLDTSVWNTCHWWDDGGCTIATNSELEWYLPEQVQVRDGALELTAENRQVIGADGKVFPYTSGMVSTGPPVHDGEAKLAFTYGAVEVRFRAPLGAGLWPAIWMLPASEESTPEIDLFEAVGQQPHQANMYFHPARATGANSERHLITLPVGQDLANDHTVRLEWTPDRLDFFFDGRWVWEVTGDLVPA